MGNLVKAVDGMAVKKADDTGVRGPLAGLTVGRMVHYLRPNGLCRPAVVLHVWDAGREDGDGLVQLAIFQDGTNDDPYEGKMLGWGSSVAYSSEPSDTGPRQTWHWPERA